MRATSASHGYVDSNPRNQKEAEEAVLSTFQSRDKSFFFFNLDTSSAHMHTLSPSPPFLRARLLRPRSQIRSILIRLLIHHGIRLRRRSERFVCDFLLDLLVIASLAELVDSGCVDLVSVALVEVDEEDDVVAEGGEAVEGGHFDGEGEEVVDEGVEDFVRHGAGGHVGDALGVWLVWGEDEGGPVGRGTFSL